LFLAVVGAALLAVSADASAGVFLTPSRAPVGEPQHFTVAVQNDPAKAGQRVPMSQVELFVPAGFTVDSFEQTPGWEQDYTIQAVQKATWTIDEEDLKNEDERAEASEHDAVFHFIGHAGAEKTYEFTVRQTYADGSVAQWGPDVKWPGNPKQSAGPGPSVEAAGDGTSGSGGTSTLAIVALVVGVLGLVAGAAALVLATRR
jgi:uncharacterized protein YcnI